MSPEQAELLECAQHVLACGSTTYKQRNGHMATLEGDDGEMCYIVPFDAFHNLQLAVEALQPS